VPSTAPYQNNQALTSRLPAAKLAPAPSQTYRLRQSPPPPPFTASANRNLPSTGGLKPAAPFSPPANLPSPTAQQNTKPQNTNQTQNQKVAIANSQAMSSATSARPEKLPKRGREDLLALWEKLRERSARNRAGSTSQVTAQQNTNQQVAGLSSEIKPFATSVRPEKLPERGREILLARREKLRQELFEGNSGSTSTARQRSSQLAAYEARQNQVYNNYPNVETKPPIYKTLKSCQKQLDDSVAVVGVVVNPQGQIISGPDFLDKKGAAGIEQATKNYVMEYPFPKTNNSSNQHFHLQFKYDTSNCPESTSK
jgi:hypothetical protein